MSSEPTPLTAESTLPVPQFLSNWRRKSCYGFRSSTLAGWLFGDTFKYVPVVLADNVLADKQNSVLLREA